MQKLTFYNTEYQQHRNLIYNIHIVNLVTVKYHRLISHMSDANVPNKSEHPCQWSIDSIFMYCASAKKVHAMFQRRICHLFDFEATVLWTVETPSTNLVRKITLALLNIPSFRETTINCRHQHWRINNQHPDRPTSYNELQINPQVEQFSPVHIRGW